MAVFRQNPPRNPVRSASLRRFVRFLPLLCFGKGRGPGRKGSRIVAAFIVAAFVVRVCIVPVRRCRNRRLREIPTRSGCASFSATEQKRRGRSETADRRAGLPCGRTERFSGPSSAGQRRSGSRSAPMRIRRVTACWVGRMVRYGPHGAERVGSRGRHGSDDAMRAACFLRVCRKSRFVRGKKRCRRAPWLYRRTPPSIRFPEALLYLQNRIIFPLD